jgi:hypothetical protein
MQRILYWWKRVTSVWDGWLIIGLALWLRLLSLRDPFFITDQGRALLAGRNILLGEWVTWGPPTSVNGLSLGPLYYYWSAAALWMSNFAVWGPALSVALANVLAIGLVWAWLHRYWGKLAAVTGAGVLAVSSLAALQAQIALEPAPLPLFSALWLWLTTRLVLRPASQRREWWVFIWITILAAIQLNASAVILAVTSLSVWWFLQAQAKKFSLLWYVGAAGVALLTVIKIVLRGSTSPSFFWQTWESFISPSQILVAWCWLLFLILGGSAWLQRQRFSLNLTPVQRQLSWILGAWASWSLLAFSFKTVSGDHALTVIFVLIAVVLGVVVQKNVPRGHARMALGAVLMYLVLRSLFTFQWISQHPHPRVSDHQTILQTITELSESQPYALLYRGHLDIYDAADDHLQYLLWLRGNAPANAARTEFSSEHPEYCEGWLIPSAAVPNRTITMYSPPETRQNFVDENPVAFTNQAVTITVGPAPSFLCR